MSKGRLEALSDGVFHNNAIIPNCCYAKLLLNSRMAI
jgi:hypothetical protein